MHEAFHEHRGVPSGHRNGFCRQRHSSIAAVTAAARRLVQKPVSSTKLQASSMLCMGRPQEGVSARRRLMHGVLDDVRGTRYADGTLFWPKARTFHLYRGAAQHAPTQVTRPAEGCTEWTPRDGMTTRKRISIAGGSMGDRHSVPEAG
jgi:hypothetical protein